MTQSSSMIGLAVASVLGAVGPEAHALVVVTQVQSRANPSTWLLNPFAQGSIAYQVIVAEHDVSAVAAFDDASLAGVDIAYISPSKGEPDRRDKSSEPGGWAVWRQRRY